MPGLAIRPSQFVLNYGVGSIIETQEGPVVIPDFEKWGRVFGRGKTPTVEDFIIHGSDVASGLLDNGLVFRIPTNIDVSQPENQPIFNTIPFPGWAFCVRHAQLYELNGGRTLCSGCISGRYTESDIKRQAIRFIRACEDGHLDDVDWHHLVHLTGASSCDNRRYNWTLRGNSLRDVNINCPHCGSGTSLSDVYNRTSNCTGRFPEKGTASQICDKKASVLLRGSSSLRIPEIISVIPIPPDSSPLYQALDNRPMLAVLATQKVWTRNQLIEKLQEMEIEAPDIYDPNVMIHLSNATNEDVVQIVHNLKKSKRERAVSVEDAKSREFHALQDAAQHGRPPDQESVDSDFQVKVQNVCPSVPFHSLKLRVTPIERLSVIMVQRGYRRLNTENRLVETSYYDGSRKYFPGVKLKGEGIFIDSGNVFPRTASNGWLQKYTLTKNPYSHPVAVWWHTLAHGQIRLFICCYQGKCLCKRG